MKSSNFICVSTTLFALFFATAARSDVFTVVVPNDLESVEGNDGQGLTSVVSRYGQRYMTVTDASQFAAVPPTHRFIVGILQRPNGSYSQPIERLVPNYIRKLGVTSRSPGGLSLTYDNNHGSTPPQLVYKGLYDNSTESIGPPGGPKEFDRGSLLQTPFYYDPAEGNLLSDLVMYSPAVEAGLDSHNSSANPFQWIWSDDPNASEASVTGNSIIVSQYLFAPVPAGDYDLSGFVDASDWTVWQDSFGSTSDLAADGNANGVVDGGDFLIWQHELGGSVWDHVDEALTVGAADAVSSVVIPEPSCLLIVGLVALVFSIRRTCCRLDSLAIVAIIASGSLGSSALAQPFSEMVVFADSTSDRGNWWIAVPPPANRIGGRFSNGPVWVEELAWQLGLEAPAPSHSGGTNYAWGGAPTGFGLIRPIGGGVKFPTLGWQIEAFFALEAARADQLFVIYGGGNDYAQQGITDATITVSNLITHITTLAAAGGEHFAVSGMQPADLYPVYRGTPEEDVTRIFSEQVNTMLTTQLPGLADQLGISIHYVDWPGMAFDAVDHPDRFGVVNTTQPAWTPTGTASAPQDYLFWDEAHYTTTFHRFVGEMAAEIVAAAFDAITLRQSSDAAYSVLGAGGLGGTSVEDQRLAQTVSIGSLGSDDERLVLKFRLPDLTAMDSLLQAATLRVKVTETTADASVGIDLFHSTSDNDLLVDLFDFDGADYASAGDTLSRATADAPYFYELDVMDLILADYAADGAVATAAFRLQSGSGEIFTLGGDEIFRPELLLSLAEVPAANGEIIVPEPRNLLQITLSLLILSVWFQRASSDSMLHEIQEDEPC